jgi:hypothetical protein
LTFSTFQYVIFTEKVGTPIHTTVLWEWRQGHCRDWWEAGLLPTNLFFPVFQQTCAKFLEDPWAWGIAVETQCAWWPTSNCLLVTIQGMLWWQGIGWF